MPRHRLLLVLLLATTSPASAGWLVTHGGARIETAGDWELDGPLVVFTTADGRLSSMRARDVDLEASRARSAEPAPEPAAAAVAAAPSRKPVLVLTDDDVSHVWPTRTSEPEPDGSGLDEPSDESAPEAVVRGSLVEVVEWQDRVDVAGNALLVTGKITNRGPGVATNTQVEVRLLDETGELLERRQATLREPVMQPGAVVPFTATFPGSPGFTTIEFDIRNRGFKVRPASDLDRDSRRFPREGGSGRSRFFFPRSSADTGRVDSTLRFSGASCALFVAARTPLLPGLA